MGRRFVVFLRIDPFIMQRINTPFYLHIQERIAALEEAFNEANLHQEKLFNELGRELEEIGMLLNVIPVVLRLPCARCSHLCAFIQTRQCKTNMTTFPSMVKESSKRQRKNTRKSRKKRIARITRPSSLKACLRNSEKHVLAFFYLNRVLLFRQSMPCLNRPVPLL
jgi:hypothetical protein